jgi:hypothetical protein
MQQQYNQVREFLQLAEPQILNRETQLTDSDKAEQLRLLDCTAKLIYACINRAINSGLTANQLQMAFTILHEANMAKVWPDGKIHRNENNVYLEPEGWQKPDLGPCFFVEKGYPEYYKNHIERWANNPEQQRFGLNYWPEPVIGYRWVNPGEILPDLICDEWMYNEGWKQYKPHWGWHTKPSDTGSLYRVPANYPITIQP